MTEAPDEWDNRLCGRITKAGKRCRAHAHSSASLEIPEILAKWAVAGCRKVGAETRLLFVAIRFFHLANAVAIQKGLPRACTQAARTGFTRDSRPIYAG
jgi:hypothetical protein